MSPPHAPKINVSFGPSGTWIIALDVDPVDGKQPCYASSAGIPEGLVERLFREQAGIERVHCATLGRNNAYFVAYKTSDGHEDSDRSMPEPYEALRSWLTHQYDRSAVSICMGDRGYFYAQSSLDKRWEIPWDWRKLNTELQRQVTTSNSQEKLAAPAFGIDTYVLLRKDGHMWVDGEYEANYPKFWADVHTHRDHPRKVVSVALNPFKSNEHFVAFDNGEYEWRIPSLRVDPSDDTSLLTPAGKAFENIAQRWAHLRSHPAVPAPESLSPDRTFFLAPVLTRARPSSGNANAAVDHERHPQIV